MSMKASEDLKLFCADPYTGWVPREKQQDELRKIAARVEEVEQRAEELERLLESANNGLEQWHTRAVMLPTDAEGVPIRVGDVLDGYGKTINVVELRYLRSGWVLISRDGNGYDNASAFARHVPTVEGVLEELLREYDRDDSELTNGEIIERFAARLRLAGEDA